MDRLTWFNDEPLFASTRSAMHQICRHAAASAGVTVVLSGEGADEVFGGYARYLLGASAAPGGCGACPAATGSWPPTRSARPDLAEAVARARGTTRCCAAASWCRTGTDGGDLFVYDQRTYLRGLLQRQDRMGMAVGVEAREPSSTTTSWSGPTAYSARPSCSAG